MKNPITIENFKSLTVKDISKIYLGKGNNCRCGCAGDYADKDDEKLLEKRLKNAQKLFAKSAEYVIASDGMYIDIVKSGDINGSYKSLTVYAW